MGAGGGACSSGTGAGGSGEQWPSGLLSVELKWNHDKVSSGDWISYMLPFVHSV